jgi:hypothetical protein
MEDLKMQLVVARLCKVGQEEFVRFWSGKYSYAPEVAGLYEENIGKPLDAGRVWALYRWKNGSKIIAEKKERAIENTYIPELGRLPRPQSREEGRGYLSRLGGGAIWGIFWLHCIRRDMFPIFDQHTYRAMAKILGGVPSEIPPSRGKKVEAYFSQYLDFTSQFSVPPRRLDKALFARRLDKALFAYGRFLKKGFGGNKPCLTRKP